MTTDDIQIIRHLFDDYLLMYASRDEHLTGLFSEDFSGFTGGGALLIKDRDEWVAITRQDFEQVKNPLRIELKDLAIQSLSDTIAVTTGFFTIHLPIEDQILSRETARLVLVFRLESSGWKICHSSISIPYHLVREGEVYPLQELAERNKFLEELVAERTAQLFEAKKTAEAANVAKSQFLASISHEIRTPLNSLVGFSSLARKTADSARLDQYHTILETSSRSLMALLDSILDMSKIEAGRFELETAPLNVRNVIESLEAQYRLHAEDKMLKFHVVVTDSVPAWVLGDVIRLRQVLVNMLANAVKFTESGEVSCTVCLSDRRAESDHSLMRFEIRDTGIGIPESKISSLFQPFRQLDPTITRKFGGTGLGLAIVHSLVKMMSGSISVQSREGEGSCFVVELPLPETSQVHNPVAAPALLSSGTVLVVEDTRFNGHLLESILTEWDQQVILAEDGWQALQLMEQLRFDLLLLDIRMPGIDGIEVARRVRQKEQERSEVPMPIFAITADTDTDTRESCLAAGINEVLAKPVMPDQLASMIAVYYQGADAAPPDEKFLLNLRICNDFGNNPERTSQYAQMLKQDIDKELQRLLTAFDCDDRTTLGLVAHTLKGLCVNLASRDPAKFAAWLQNNALLARPEQMERVIKKLCSILQ